MRQKYFDNFKEILFYKMVLKSVNLREKRLAMDISCFEGKMKFWNVEKGMEVLFMEMMKR